jgi:simple sugar transport system substrate-binding protein
MRGNGVNLRSSTARALVMAAAVAAVVAGCGSSNSGGGDSGTSAAAATGGKSPSTSGKQLKVIVVTHGVPSDPFWNTVQKGVKDAGADFNVKTDYQSLQGAVDPGQEARLMDAAIAQKPDGIAVTIPDPSAMRAPIKKALDAGIPVIAFNSGDTDYQKLGVKTFVGFSAAAAGTGLGQELSKLGSKNAICVNHQQGNLTLETMCSNFQKSFVAAGGKAKQLVVDGADPSGTQSDVTAALSQDKTIDGVFGLGPGSHGAVLKAIEASGRQQNIKFCDFNLIGGIVQDIAAGKTDCTGDQQGYLQGYLPVEFLAQFKRLGVTPLGHVLTGPVLVTKANVSQALALSKANVR